MCILYANRYNAKLKEVMKSTTKTTNGIFQGKLMMAEAKAEVVKQTPSMIKTFLVCLSFVLISKNLAGETTNLGLTFIAKLFEEKTFLIVLVLITVSLILIIIILIFTFLKIIGSKNKEIENLRRLNSLEE